MYSCAITAAKLSVIVTLTRVFPYKALRRILYGTSAVLICLLLASIPLSLFQCDPTPIVSDGGDLSETQCVNFIDIEYTSTILQIVTSGLLVLVPLPYLRTLQCVLSLKVLLGLVFLTGMG